MSAPSEGIFTVPSNPLGSNQLKQPALVSILFKNLVCQTRLYQKLPFRSQLWNLARRFQGVLLSGTMQHQYILLLLWKMLEGIFINFTVHKAIAIGRGPIHFR